MDKKYEMIINNKTVFEFYEKNKSLNFEQVRLLCIGLFENILQKIGFEGCCPPKPIVCANVI